MDKSNNNYLGIIGCAILYAITSFASAFLGFLSPWCWIVVFPALAAILGAPSYLWAASRWQRFGVATLFALVLAVVLLVMGEIDVTQSLLMVAVGIASDVIRQVIGTTYKRSILLAYPVLPLGILVWLMKLWTDSEWYYQGAAEEIGADYADGLRTLSSIWALLLVIVLTLAAGYIGIRIAAAKMKSGKKLG
jgi:hypothetical protein